VTPTSFADLFGRPPDVEATAPGRVNLIGEHTDYNEGLVLPLAIARRTTVACARRDDERVRAASASVGPGEIVEYRLGAERRGLGWIDYVQGVTRTLATEGHALGGVDLAIASDVPVGSGLSSSAALEVAVLRALRRTFDLRLDDVQLALVGHRAESLFVGARVGIMDQMACSLAEERRALFLDTRTLGTEHVPMPDGVELVVVDSGVTHAHASGDYNARRAECERACALLGVPTLRDVAVPELAAAMALPAPLGRRVRHVVTENARVLDAVGAMRDGDAARLGAILLAGHASLRDDYEVSVPDVDLLVELLAAQRGVHGARMTGGGFGGAVVALAEKGAGRRVAVEAAARFAERSSRTPTVLIPPP
jgi:galactokinase